MRDRNSKREAAVLGGERWKKHFAAKALRAKHDSETEMRTTIRLHHRFISLYCSDGDSTSVMSRRNVGR